MYSKISKLSAIAFAIFLSSQSFASEEIIPGASTAVSNDQPVTPQEILHNSLVNYHAAKMMYQGKRLTYEAMLKLHENTFSKMLEAHEASPEENKSFAAVRLAKMISDAYTFYTSIGSITYLEQASLMLILRTLEENNAPYLPAVTTEQDESL